MGLRQTVQCGLRMFVTIHVHEDRESRISKSGGTSRDFVDFLFVHLFSSISSFLCFFPIGAMLNVLLTCSSYCMAPVLRSGCLLRLVLIYMVLFLLQTIFHTK